MGAYSDFALFYDLLQSDVDYEGIAVYYDRLIQKFGGKRSLTLDLACGTGKITRIFSGFGYDMIAADVSESMLGAAIREGGGSIQYLCQDMTELNMFGTLDNVISVLDGINHLNDTDELRTVFGRVSLFMNPSGLFVFDVNTVYKHEQVLGNNTFVDERDGLYTVWQNFYAGNGQTEIELDFFHEENGCYKRYRDAFTETAFELDVISGALNDSGLRVLACYDWLTEDAVCDCSEKAVFVARKE